MRVTFYSYPQDCGDGSAFVILFKTKEEAERFQKRNEEYGGWAEDCVAKHVLYVDDKGNITSGCSKLNEDGDVV